MKNLILLSLQVLSSLFMFYLAFRWWIKPRLDKLPQYEALLPVVFYHGIRFVGLTFMADGQFYDSFPDNMAAAIGIGDYIVSILALLTAIALKSKTKIAIPLVWTTIVLGIVDFFNAFRLLGGQEFWKYDIEGTWYFFLFIGPITIITSIYIIKRLIQPLPENS
ncbi:MAG: hypothetical protein AAGE59_21580 [Cyanobacteria bacterium P01_F01_bin.86]